MHRAGDAGKPGLGFRPPEREGDHARGEAVPLAVSGNGRVDLRPDPGVEQTLLDGRLIRTDSPQLGRPIGGEQQQRHPGVEGLHRGREEVRDSRAAGAHERDGDPGLPCDAQGGEPGDPLVDPHVHAQRALVGEGRRGQRESL